MKIFCKFIITSLLAATAVQPHERPRPSIKLTGDQAFYLLKAWDDLRLRVPPRQRDLRNYVLGVELSSGGAVVRFLSKAELTNKVNTVGSGGSWTATDVDIVLDSKGRVLRREVGQ